MLLLAASLAHAQTAVDFADDFNAYSAAAFTGTAGYVSGYPADAWGASVGGTLYALTDDTSGTWGSLQGADNHLVYTLEAWSDFTLDVTFTNAVDNDGVGVVFRYADSMNFYIAFLTDDAGPGTGTGAPAVFVGSRIYRVQAGFATLVATSASGYALGTHGLSVVADGSQLDVYLDGGLLLSGVDATFTSGFVGLYCYNSGSAAGNSCVYDDLTVSLTDADTDGYPDATLGGDDCDDADDLVNPGQPEIAADGIDNDCDGFEDCLTDGDSDGYGSVPLVPSADFSCAAAGLSGLAGDCDDTSAAVNPAQPEVADGLDNDCSGLPDDGIDTDGDGLDDYTESVLLGTDPYQADTDGDGVDDGGEVADSTNPLATDSDADGLSDGAEAAAGTDPLDTDTDNDGLNDGTETGLGTDPLAADTDGEGLSDGTEVSLGTDPTLGDTDADGLSDYEEIAFYATNPLLADTDGGGVSDGNEVSVDGTNPLDGADDLLDSDGDGLSDPAEIGLGTDPLLPDTDADGATDGQEVGTGTDPLDDDSDDDGSLDGAEAAAGTDPLNPDTDGDGLTDGAEAIAGTNPLVADTDGDTLSDGAEALLGTDPLLADTDLDGLDDPAELALGTDPTLADTDGAGVDDGQELADGTDPLDPTDDLDDSDGDGLTDPAELALGTNPFSADTDEDGVTDGDEVANGTDPLVPQSSQPEDTGETSLPTNNDRDAPPDAGSTDLGGACGCAQQPGTATAWLGFVGALLAARRRIR